MSLSKIRQNFHANAEALINKQINLELYASYVYMAMAAYFSRDDVALHGFAKRFDADSKEEREHAQKFITYQTKRGGKAVFHDVKAPKKSEWGSASEAVEDALELEKIVNQSLLDLHKACDTDPHLQDFIETEYLGEQVDAMKGLGDLLTKMKRAGDSVGLHIIDKEMHEDD